MLTDIFRVSGIFIRVLPVYSKIKKCQFLNKTLCVTPNEQLVRKFMWRYKFKGNTFKMIIPVKLVIICKLSYVCLQFDDLGYIYVTIDCCLNSKHSKAVQYIMHRFSFYWFAKNSM